MIDNTIFKFFKSIDLEIIPEGDFYFTIKSPVFNEKLYIYNSSDDDNLKVFIPSINEFFNTNDFINFYIDSFINESRDNVLKNVNSISYPQIVKIKPVSDKNFFSHIVDSIRIDSIIEYKDVNLENLNSEYFNNIFYSDKNDAIGFPLFYEGLSNFIYFGQNNISFLNNRPGYWISKIINKTVKPLFCFCPVSVLQFFYLESYNNFVYSIPNPDQVQVSSNRLFLNLKKSSISLDSVTFVYNHNNYETLPLFKTYLALLNSFTGNIIIRDCYPLNFTISFKDNNKLLKFISSFKETQAVINKLLNNYDNVKNTIFSMKKHDQNGSLSLEFNMLINHYIMISFIKFLQGFYKPKFNLTLVNPLCESLI